MATETKVNAQANPALANELAAKAMAEAQQDAMVTAAKPVAVTTPPNLSVELPGGLYDPFEGVTREAEIRELTGADEEAIAGIADAGKALITILERATVKIGDDPADKETLDALLAGDREMILLAIRKATFGDTVEVGPGFCPSCQAEQTFTIDLNKDVEVKKLKEEDRNFTVDCKVGKVSVTLPNGYVQKSIVTSTNKNSAELDTLLLKGCVLSINDGPTVTVNHIKNLSLKDRRDIITEITNRNPGPQLSEIKKPCVSCGVEVPLPLTLADLFRE